MFDFVYDIINDSAKEGNFDSIEEIVHDLTDCIHYATEKLVEVATDLYDEDEDEEDDDEDEDEEE